MVKEVLKLRTDNGLGANNPYFKGIELESYTYTAPRMGIPSLTATIKWNTPLDKEWTGREYIEIAGQRLYLRATPTSEKDNDDARYTHSLSFMSEINDLSNVYFYDAVPSYAKTYDKPCTNSTTFKLFGDISEFVDRLNCAFLYAGIGDSMLKTKTNLTMSDTPVGDGFCAVLSTEGGGDLTQTKELSWDDKYLWEAITEGYNQFKIPFLFQGKKMIWNHKQTVLNHTFEYGFDNELLSVRKENANAKVVNRVTFKGSSENIPYYYPNETEYGHITLVPGTNNNVLTANDFSVKNYTQMFNTLRADEHLTLRFTETSDASISNILWSYRQSQRPLTREDYSLGEYAQAFPDGDYDPTWGPIEFALYITISTSTDGEYIITDIPTEYWDLNSVQNEKAVNLIPALTSAYLCNDGVNWTLKQKAEIENGQIGLGELKAGTHYLQIRWDYTPSLAIDPHDVSPRFRIDSINIEGKLHAGTFYWEKSDGSRNEQIGRFGMTLNVEPTQQMVGDTIKWAASGRMPFQTSLMPPLYRETLGKERFYNSQNERYKDKDGNYYVFPNPLLAWVPSDKISPTLGIARALPAGTVLYRSVKNAIEIKTVYPSKTTELHSGTFPNGYPFEDGLTYSTYCEMRSTRPDSNNPFGTIPSGYEGCTSIRVKVLQPTELFVHVNLNNGKTISLFDDSANEIGGTIIFQEIDASNQNKKLCTFKYTISEGEYCLTALGTTARLSGFSYITTVSMTADSPNEYIFIDETVKPTIDGIKNSQNQLFGQIAGIGYDKDDNDNLKDIYSSDDTASDAKKYEHSFFYIKLHKFNGTNGFNLFEHASQTGPMTIQMTSGKCNGCKFKIQATDYTTTDGIKTYRNGVRITSSGDLVDGNFEDKYSASEFNEDNQDTTQNELWICVQKDVETFGVIMPNRKHSYMPAVGDKFNIINIDLPQPYIDAAEALGRDKAIKEMADNNMEKFKFQIAMSRIFLQDNPAVTNQIDENTMIKVKYDGLVYSLYVSQMTIECADDEALMDIKVDLSDSLATGGDFLSEVVGSAIKLLPDTTVPSTPETDETPAVLDDYISKRRAERTEYALASDYGFEVGNFISGISGGIFFKDPKTGETYIEADTARFRVKTIFQELEVIKSSNIGGETIITPGGGITITFIENVTNAYKCYFTGKAAGTAAKCNMLAGDFAYCAEFNTADGARVYWRKVIEVNNIQSYIILSDVSAEKLAGSAAPQVGDSVCQLGSSTASRQNAIILSSVRTNSPCVTLYSGISTFSLNDKAIIEYGIDPQDGLPYFNCYGKAYVGPKDKSTYLEFTPQGGAVFKGNIHASSTIDGDVINTYIKDNAPITSEWIIEPTSWEIRRSTNAEGTVLNIPQVIHVVVYKNAGEDGRVADGTKRLFVSRVRKNGNTEWTAIQLRPTGASANVLISGDDDLAILFQLRDTDGTTVLQNLNVPVVADTGEIATLKSDFKVTAGEFSSLQEAIGTNGEKVYSKISQTANEINLTISEVTRDNLAIASSVVAYFDIQANGVNSRSFKLYDTNGLKTNDRFHISFDWEITPGYTGDDNEWSGAYIPLIAVNLEVKTSPSYQYVATGFYHNNDLPFDEGTLSGHFDSSQLTMTATGVTEETISMAYIMLDGFTRGTILISNFTLQKDVQNEDGTWENTPCSKWAPSRQDSKKLVDTGIDIRSGMIKLTADNVRIINNAGVLTAMIDSDGELLVHRVICYNSLGGVAASLNADDTGEYIINYPNAVAGQEVKRLAINPNDPNYAITYYLEDGTERWGLGPTGISMLSSNPNAFVLTALQVNTSGPGNSNGTLPVSTTIYRIVVYQPDMSLNDGTHTSGPWGETKLGDLNGRYLHTNINPEDAIFEQSGYVRSVTYYEPGSPHVSNGQKSRLQYSFDDRGNMLKLMLTWGNSDVSPYAINDEML